MKRWLLAALAALALIAAPVGLEAKGSHSSSHHSGKTKTPKVKTVKVKGYTKKDGTHVKAHTRSKPKKQ